MSLVTKNPFDFKKYIDNIINEVINEKEIYQGNISEERYNGKIAEITIMIDKKK